MQSKPLRELANIVRSKNAGPHRLTLDVLFESHEVFCRVRDSGALNIAAVAAAYGVPAEMVTSSVVYEPGNAFKFTLRRPVVQGAVGDTDHYGAQQHAPLLDIEIPWENDTGRGDPSTTDERKSLQ
jgi:hypothetical protein